MKRVVVVGGGLAGLRAAEALRTEGFDGSITMVGAESAPPYDRPPLSKQVLLGEQAADGTAYRSADQYRTLEVTLLLGRAATGLDLAGQTVLIGDSALGFDGLIIASGARARSITWPPPDGVHVLRTADDARRIRKALQQRPKVVVIGAGFIGAEVASSARQLGLDVTVVEAAPAPLVPVVGEAMAQSCAALHRANGTVLLTGVPVTALRGGRRVEQVCLANGQTLPADLVVVGIGVSPNVDWLAESGIAVTDGVLCDGRLQVAPNVYAAGDVASFPHGARLARYEHWSNAVEQGRHAARNLLAGAGAVPFEAHPYFWSDQYGVNIQHVGAATPEVKVVHGSVTEHEFLAFYHHGGRIVGAFAMNSPALLAKSRALVDRCAPWETALSHVAA